MEFLINVKDCAIFYKINNEEIRKESEIESITNKIIENRQQWNLLRIEGSRLVTQY